MLAVLYKVYLHPEKEKSYEISWGRISNHLIEKSGALGSSLHKNEESFWIIYSRWPDRETYEAAWSLEAQKNLPSPLLDELEKMRACCMKKEKPLFLTLVATTF